MKCGVPELKSDACRWTLGATIPFGIGQSALLTPPLNQAVYVAALANGGSVMQPTLVHMVRDASGRVTATQQREVVNHVPASPDNLQAVREGLREEINRPSHMY